MRFHSVVTLDEAIGLLAENGEEIQVLAGGTDVMVQYQRGEIGPEAMLHIEGIKGLREVETGNGTVTFGALVTHSRVARDPGLNDLLPALSEAAATVGGWQTQEVGTIVGNVCNASPAADTLPPLLNADAVVHLASVSGRRAEPLQQFILGRRRTSRRPDEIVTALEVQPLRPRNAEAYLKVAPRSAMEVALVGLAARLAFSKNGEVEEARISVCSVSEVPYRAGEAESALLGSHLDDETVREAGALLTRSADPIDDHRASAAYRRRVLSPLLARAVEVCRNRLEKDDT